MSLPLFSNYRYKRILDSLFFGIPMNPINYFSIGLLNSIGNDLGNYDGTLDQQTVEVKKTIHAVDPATNISTTRDTGYNRVMVSCNTNDLIVDSDYMITNVNDLVFPDPKEDWGNIVGFIIYDDEGMPLSLHTLQITTPITINKGDPGPIIYAGQLQISRVRF